jgi:hypothetical protein
MKTYWGSGGIAPPFLTLAIDGGDWSAYNPATLLSWKELLVLTEEEVG